MGEGREEYPVLPTLSWSRDWDGQRTVTEMEIEEVRLDEEGSKRDCEFDVSSYLR